MTADLHRGIIKAYTSATHVADVQIVGSLPTYVTAVPVATDIAAAEVLVGRECTVLFFDESDAVVITVHGAVPAPPAGGGTITVQKSDVTVDAAVTTLDFLGADFDVTSAPAGEANVSIAAALARLGLAQTWTAIQTFSAAIRPNGALQDSGGATRLTLATTSPHVKATGDFQATGNVMARGLGAFSDRYGFVVDGVMPTTGNGQWVGLFDRLDVTPPTADTNGVYGVFGEAIRRGAANTIQVAGLSFQATVWNTGAVAELDGVTVQLNQLQSTGGSVTEMYGLRVPDPLFVFNGTSTLVAGNSIGDMSLIPATRRYGLLINDFTVAGGTQWPIFYGVDAGIRRFAVDRQGLVHLPVFTTALRPAAGVAGRICFVSDGPAGSKFQGDDGVNWVGLG